MTKDPETTNDQRKSTTDAPPSDPALRDSSGHDWSSEGGATPEGAATGPTSTSEKQKKAEAGVPDDDPENPQQDDSQHAS